MKYFLLIIIGVSLTIKITQAQTAIEFYVDPDWTGTKSGTASEPWSTLDNAAFTTIETALSSGNVIVYFSAREVSSDTDETSLGNLNFANFTNPGTYRLTIDGMSKYNTDDSAPSWFNYSGSSRFKFSGANITTGNSGSTTDAPKDYITIKGFKIYGPSGNQAIYLKDFNDGIVEDNYISHNAGATTGPGLILTYAVATDAQAQATRSVNVIIRNNTVEDNYGEGIYINGCKESAVCQTGMDNILIYNNTIINPGSKGGEGDGIDIKNYCTNCTVKGNIVYHTSYLGTTACITSHSIATIENNFVYNCGYSGIRIAEFSGYDVWDIALDGGEIRNNIIIGDSYTSAAQYGIRIYSFTGGYDLRNIKVLNNTLYGLSSNNSIGIYIAEDNPSANMTGINIQNNIVSTVNGLEFNATIGVLNIHNHNDYYDTSGNVYSYGGTNANCGTLNGQESNSICSNPIFISTTTPYTDANFKVALGSLVIDTGTILTSFSTDYAGVFRPQGLAWDIGAYEYVEAVPPPDTVPPSAPTVLVVE